MDIVDKCAVTGPPVNTEKAGNWQGVRMTKI